MTNQTKAEICAIGSYLLTSLAASFAFSHGDVGFGLFFVSLMILFLIPAICALMPEIRITTIRAIETAEPATARAYRARADELEAPPEEK